MPNLAIILFGTPRIQRDDQVLAVDTRKAIGLLAYLAATGRPHSREALATLFWPEYDQQRALANLRRTLWALAKAIGESRLDSTRERIALRSGEQACIDIVEFHRHIAAWREHQHASPTICAACVEHLNAALALHSGDFLSGFILDDSSQFEDWRFFEAERLRQDAAAATERLMYHHSARGDWDNAGAAARRWLTFDPLHEDAHRHLMQILAWSGQRSAALRQYAECVRLLEAELGMAPGHETETLYRVIRDNQLPPPERVATPPSAPRTNLAAAATPFVGREAELARIAEMLGDPGCRLVTLVGIGGLGKTRLAVEAARQALAQAQDGAYLVPLVDVAHAHLIGTAIAESIGLPLQGNLDPLVQIGRYLSDKRMVLLLDNFEHLLEAAEQLLALLGAAPHLKILVTSRQRLRLHEEWIVELDGLATPPADAAASLDYAAIQLFVRSAQRLQSDFHLNEAVSPAVSEICRLVGGLPLGIELAAAWVRTLSCAEIAHEIRQSLDILTTSARNVPERQRSLRAVLDSAWAMLGDAEQRALGGLALFRGGARREAIASVLGTPLPVLAALVDAALTRRTAAGRYLLHELVRQYAAERERAGGDAEAPRRHAAFYQELVRVADQGLKTTNQGHWLAEIQSEEDNIRAALDWALGGGDAELGLRLCGDMWTFWLMRGHMAEARHWIDRALALAGPAIPGEVYARVLYAAGDAARLRGEYDRARDFASRALALYESGDHDEGMVAALVCLGNIAYNQGEADRAYEHYNESLGLLRQLDLPLRTAHVLSNLGLICQDRGDYAQAQALYRESLAVQRRLRYDRGVANTLSNLGWLAVVLGSYAEARELLEESLSIRTGLDDRRGCAISLTNLGELELMGGELAAAARYTDQGLALFREIDDRRGVASGLAQSAAIALERDDLDRALRDYRESLALGYALQQRPLLVGAMDGLGRCLVRSGDLAAAARLLAAAERWGAEFAVLPNAAERQRTAAALAVIRATLDEACLNVQRLEGQRLDLEQICGEWISQT